MILAFSSARPGGPYRDLGWLAPEVQSRAHPTRRSEMPKLRHVAVHTSDPDKTAEFYKQVFDMVEVGRTDSPLATGVYLSDGDLNMAVLKFKTAEAADRR